MQTGDEQMIGQTLGHYRLEAVLGRGGMGLVYLARQTHPARHVAIKVLRYQPEMGNRSTVLARFQQEANTAAMLEHVHIVPVFDYGELEQVAYLVMPYINGGSLGDVLRRQGRLPLAQALDYLQQAGSALDYAHARGVIHRDLKPSNFLLYPNGRLLLADFGIARVLEGSGLSGYVTLSTPNAIVGTPAYMAPEMARGGQIGTRADIYSLGVVFFQMLSGRVPFQGPDPLAVLYQHVNDPFPLLHTVDPSLPAGIDAVLQKATAKRPEERYLYAGDMVKDLQAVLRQSGVSPMPQAPYASDVAATYIHARPPQQVAPSTATTVEHNVPNLPLNHIKPQYQEYHPYSRRSTNAPDRPALPRRSKNISFKVLSQIVLIIVLITTVVFVGLHFGGVFAAFQPPSGTPASTPSTIDVTKQSTQQGNNTPTPIDAAKQVVTLYYDDINQKDYKDAYNLLAPDFQNGLPYSTFADGYGRSGPQQATINSANQNGDGSVFVLTTVNAKPWNARLILVNGSWRIESACLTQGCVPA